MNRKVWPGPTPTQNVEEGHSQPTISHRQSDPAHSQRRSAGPVLGRLTLNLEKAKES